MCIRDRYDAHEYFSQLKEVVERPFIHKIWKRIEAWAIPRFKSGYTVSNSIALEFKKLYKADYITIRNMPLRKPVSYTHLDVYKRQLYEPPSLQK